MVSATSLSQLLVDLVPGATYNLQYYYRVYPNGRPLPSPTTLTVAIGGQVVDTYSYSPYIYMIGTNAYTMRSATYVATAESATLLFTLGGSYTGNFALDDITLTLMGI